MPPSVKKPVLIIGGSGVVGSLAAKTLRRLQPDLPITIGGRDLAKAEAVARSIDGADAAAVDLDRPDLGQPADRAYSAVAVFVKDAGLRSLAYAQQHSLPYVSTSSMVYEIGPEVALAAHRPAAAPILLASHWLAGVATLAVLHFARAFRRVETIEIAVVLDEEDMGGPAAAADYDRIISATTKVMIRQDGKWTWIGGEAAKRRFAAVDGVELEGQAYSPMDVISLGAATDARTIRLDLVLGESATRRRGEPFSTEIIIEIAGERPDGTLGRSRHELVHPQGQAPLTALGIATGVERLLGLDNGMPAVPGLYLPELLIEPDHLLRRLEAFGTSIRTV